MLAAIVLLLENNTNAPRPNAHEAHGWFFHRIAEHHPELATQLHHNDLNPKPFTIAVIGARDRLALRVTLTQHRNFNQDLYSSLSPALYGAVGETIRLGEQAYRVKAVMHEGHSLARLATHSSLLQAARGDEPLVMLEFVTGTTFRRGQLLMPVPEPRRVFHGLVQKWNAGSNVPVDEGFLPWVEETVSVHNLRGRTRLMDMGFIKPGSGEAVKYAGYTGTVTFQATDANPLRVKQFGALSRFAMFAGVGHKTTQGLGVTRFVAPRILEREVNADGVHPAWTV